MGVSLAVGGAAAAQAVTTQSNFNTNVPRFQQSHYWEYQNKTTSSASEVRFSSIGGGYTMNVKAQNGANGNQYSEQTAISTGSTRSIPNSTPSGTATRLIVTNNTWTTVQVNVTGWFKTN
ncbi:hypothetical protein [Microbacterium aurum]